MPSYFVGFDLAKINSLGIFYKIPNQSVQVFNVTANQSLPAVTSDAFGVVHGGSLNVAAGTTVRFSVTGQTATLERLTTAAANDVTAITELTLLLDDTFVQTPQLPAYNEIYMRTNATSDPVRLGTVEPGGTLSVPFNPAHDTEVEIFAIAKSASGLAHTFDLSAAPSVKITPNRETMIPVIYQDGAATNTQIKVRATNYSPLARTRKIQRSASPAFTNPSIAIQGMVNEPGMLDPLIIFNRSTNLTTSQTIYVRVAHSSTEQTGNNNPIYGPWSNVLTCTFPNSSGTGGTGGGPPPPGGGTGGGGGVGACFPGGTPVLLADETEKPIEKIKIGDLVLCFDDNGDIYRSRVKQLFEHEVREYFILDFGFEQLKVTGEHRLFTDKGWVAVNDIFEGCYIKEYRNGWHEREVRTKSRVKCGAPVKVYNFEVAQYHTYFAGRKAAHNLKSIND